MTVFYRAGEKVRRIIDGLNESTTPYDLENEIGCDADMCIHYKGDEVYLEMAEGSNPRGCPEVTDLKLMRVLEGPSG